MVTHSAALRNDTIPEKVIEVSPTNSREIKVHVLIDSIKKSISMSN